METDFYLISDGLDMADITYYNCDAPRTMVLQGQRRILPEIFIITPPTGLLIALPTMLRWLRNS